MSNINASGNMPEHDGQSSESPKRKLQHQFLTPGQMKARKSPDWLVKGMLKERTTTLLYGAAKSGKSYIALDLALSIASGLDFLGNKVIKGGVLYIAAEADETISERLIAWELAHGIDSGTLPIRFIPMAVRLMERSDVNSFMDDIQAILDNLVEGDDTEPLQEKPVLIIVDTLAKSVVGADGNSNKDMDIALDSVEQIRKRFNCAAVVLHHIGKRDDTPRGASCLIGTPDTLILVKRENTDDSRITVECAEMRYAAKFHTMYLDLKTIDLGPGWTSCVVEVASNVAQAVTAKPPAPNPRELQERQVLEALKGFGSTGTTYLEWKNSVPSTISDGGFDRIRKLLVGAGKVLQTKSSVGNRMVNVYIAEDQLPNSYSMGRDGVISLEKSTPAS